MAPPNPPFPPPLHCCTLIGKACSLPIPFLLLLVVITLLFLKQFRILRKWIVCLFWFDEFSRKGLLTIYENVHIGPQHNILSLVGSLFQTASHPINECLNMFWLNQIISTILLLSLQLLKPPKLLHTHIVPNMLSIII